MASDHGVNIFGPAPTHPPQRPAPYTLGEAIKDGVREVSAKIARSVGGWFGRPSAEEAAREHEFASFRPWAGHGQLQGQMGGLGGPVGHVQRFESGSPAPSPPSFANPAPASPIPSPAPRSPEPALLLQPRPMQVSGGYNRMVVPPETFPFRHPEDTAGTAMTAAKPPAVEPGVAKGKMLAPLDEVLGHYLRDKTGGGEGMHVFDMAARDRKLEFELQLGADLARLAKSGGGRRASVKRATVPRPAVDIWSTAPPRGFFLGGVVAPPPLPPAPERKSRRIEANQGSRKLIAAATDSDDAVEVLPKPKARKPKAPSLLEPSLEEESEVEVVEAPKGSLKPATKSAPKQQASAKEAKEAAGEEVTKVETSEDFWRVQIEAVYRRRNPRKLSDIPGLLEKHKGKEMHLYKKVCQRYDLNPAKLYSDPKAWDSEDKDFKDDDDEAEPTATSTPAPSTVPSGVPPVPALFLSSSSGSQTSGGSIFGASTATTGAGSLFGTSTASSGSGSLFGASSATGSLFGTSAASTGDSIFGDAKASASTGSSLFGGTSASTGGIFGASSPSSAGALFGAPASSSSGGSIFSIPPAPSDPDTKINIFSGATQAEKRFASASGDASSGSLFGDNASGLFAGAPISTAPLKTASEGASPGGLFGSLPAVAKSKPEEAADKPLTFGEGDMTTKNQGSKASTFGSLFGEAPAPGAGKGEESAGGLSLSSSFGTPSIFDATTSGGSAFAFGGAAPATSGSGLFTFGGAASGSSGGSSLFGAPPPAEGGFGRQVSAPDELFDIKPQEPKSKRLATDVDVDDEQPAQPGPRRKADPEVLAKRKIVKGRRSAAAKTEAVPKAEFPPPAPPASLFGNLPPPPLAGVEGLFPPGLPGPPPVPAMPAAETPKGSPKEADEPTTSNPFAGLTSPAPKETKSTPAPEESSSAAPVNAAAGGEDAPAEGPVKVETKEDFWRVQIEAIYRKRNPMKLTDVPKMMEKHKGKEVILFKKVCQRYDLDPSKIYTNEDAWAGEDREFKDDPDEPAEGTGAGSASTGSLFGDAAGGAGVPNLFGAATGSLFGSDAGTGAPILSKASSPGGALFGTGGGSVPPLFGSSSGSGGSIFGGSSGSGGSIFGASSGSGASIFGASSGSGGSLFGASSGSGGSLFGASSGSGGSIFGASSGSGGSIFGASSGSGGSIFGASSGSGGSLFGGSSGSGGSLFGDKPEEGKSTFGASSSGSSVSSGSSTFFEKPASTGSGSLFGSSGGSTASAGNLFGSGANMFGGTPSASSGTSIFGAASTGGGNMFASSTSNFGTSSPSTSAFVFGGSASSGGSGSSSSSLFGNAFGGSGTGGSSIFGEPGKPAASSIFDSGNIFAGGGSNPFATGTADAPSTAGNIFCGGGSTAGSSLFGSTGGSTGENIFAAGGSASGGTSGSTNKKKRRAE